MLVVKVDILVILAQLFAVERNEAIVKAALFLKFALVGI